MYVYALHVCLVSNEVVNLHVSAEKHAQSFAKNKCS